MGPAVSLTSKNCQYGVQPFPAGEWNLLPQL